MNRQSLAVRSRSRHQASSSAAFSTQAQFSPGLRIFRHQDRTGGAVDGNAGAESPPLQLSPREILERSHRYVYQGARFASAREAAYAAVMKDLLGWRLELEKTYEVPLLRTNRGNTVHVDFFVAGRLVEIHVPSHRRFYRAWRDFENRQQYQEFLTELRSCPNWDAQEVVRAKWDPVVAQSYQHRRSRIKNQNPSWRGTELVVVTTPEQFYRDVIKPHAVRDPGEAAVMALFKRHIESVRFEPPRRRR